MTAKKKESKPAGIPVKGSVTVPPHPSPPKDMKISVTTAPHPSPPIIGKGTVTISPHPSSPQTVTMPGGEFMKKGELRDAGKELSQLRGKYGHLKELASVFKAIDKFLAGIDKP